MKKSTIDEIKKLYEESEYPELKGRIEDIKEIEQKKALEVVQKIMIDFDIQSEKLSKLNRSIRKSKTEYENIKTGKRWGGLGRKPQDMIDNPENWVLVK